MKRVPAYWGKRQTTPKACPLGKRACFFQFIEAHVRRPVAEMIWEKATQELNIMKDGEP